MSLLFKFSYDIKINKLFYRNSMNLYHTETICCTYLIANFSYRSVKSFIQYFNILQFIQYNIQPFCAAFIKSLKDNSMDTNKQTASHSPIKLNPKTSRHNRSNNKSLYQNGKDSKYSQKITTVSHRSDSEYDSPQLQYHNIELEKLAFQKQIGALKNKLAKEEEKNFIYQQFFKKIEKALYNECSEHLTGQNIKDYEKLEWHLSDMVKRVEKGSQCTKLAAVPVMYKKNSTVTRIVTYKNPTNK